MRSRLAVGVVFSALLIARNIHAQVQGAWATTGTTPTAVELGVQVRLGNGNVLMAGGTDGTNYFDTAQLYNPSKGTWSATGSMATGRAYFAAVVLPGAKVLVEGGTGAGSAIFASAEIYDPSTGKWSPAGSMSVARFWHTATLLPNGKVLVTGGCVSIACSTVTAASEIFDPSTKTWTTTTPMNTARGFPSAMLLPGNGKVLVVGGYNRGGLNSTELYNPGTAKWTTGPTSIVPRFQHSATLLANGKVLVAGGSAPRYAYNQAELYDPKVNTLTPTGSMSKGRYLHTATALPNNTVLLAAGEVLRGCGKYPCGTPTAIAEIYDVALGTFSQTGPLTTGRAYHTASLLPSNDVLVAGGCTGLYCNNVTAVSEIYTPLTLSMSSLSLNFGLEQAHVTSPAQTVTVTNVSHGPVTFTSIAASGDYAQTNTCPAALLSGDHCTISVTFKPTVTGTHTGAVTLHDNSVGSPTQTIALTGIGEQYAITLTPNPLTLPSVIPGSSTTASATVTNDGGGPVNVTGISITPADGVFTVTSSNCPSTLGVQQTCMVTVTFAPPDSIPYTETLQVFDNAPGSPHLLTLMGTGID